jgi:hypothetical protein
LKGHGFSRAVQVVYFCHPERTLVREGSAFPTFSATSLVVPNSRLYLNQGAGFSPAAHPTAANIYHPLASMKTMPQAADKLALTKVS